MEWVIFPWVAGFLSNHWAALLFGAGICGALYLIFWSMRDVVRMVGKVDQEAEDERIREERHAKLFGE